MSKVYYTTSHAYTFKSFIDVEVNERGNYRKQEINKWRKKYKLHDDSILIWVSPFKFVAFSYLLSADERDDAKKMKEEDMYDVFEIKDSEGFVIEESDDGDDGLLFVYK